MAIVVWPLRAVPVGEVGLVRADGELALDFVLGRGVVLVGGVSWEVLLGAGALNSSCAGPCRRAGNAPAAAATASPVSATNTAAAAMPTRDVNRVARRSKGAGAPARAASR